MPICGLKHSGKTAVALAVFPNAQSRIPPPALASVAWCRAIWLASLATSHSTKRPCSRCPLGGRPDISLFGASLLSLCLIDITLIACRYAVLSIREKQRLHSLFFLMPNPASPRPPSLRSHGVVLFGSLLSPLRPPPSALAPVRPPLGLPKITLIVGVNKMVLLAHVRPDLDNRERVLDVSPDIPSRFSLLLASLAIALWRERLRALNIHHGKKKVSPWKEKIFHGKKKVSPWKENCLPWKEKSFNVLVKYQKLTLKPIRQ